MSLRMVLGAAVIILGCIVAQFARDSAPITLENKYWKQLRLVRIVLGVVIALATLGVLIWAAA